MKEEAAAANTKREALLHFIFKHSFLRGKFKLSSGKESTFYLDVKQTTLDAKGSLLVAEILFDEMVRARADSIGGLTMGADPIVGSVVCLSALREHPLRGFMVRKAPKEHGRHKLVEGKIEKGDRVIIVDDVITTGGSAYKAVEAVRELDCEVVKVIPVVDRNEGGRELFESKGIEYRPILAIDDIFGLEKELAASMS